MPTNVVYVQPTDEDPYVYWDLVSASPNHLVMVHCSNYEDNTYHAYPFSCLETAKAWLDKTDYDSVVVSTAMVDHPEYAEGRH